MAKKRVFELSKELDIASKDIVQFLQEFGADVKNHMSTVEDHVATIVRKKFRPDTVKETSKPAPASAPVPKASPVANPAGVRRPDAPGMTGQGSPQRPATRPVQNRPAPDQTSRPQPFQGQRPGGRPGSPYPQRSEPHQPQTGNNPSRPQHAQPGPTRPANGQRIGQAPQRQEGFDRARTGAPYSGPNRPSVNPGNNQRPGAPAPRPGYPNQSAPRPPAQHHAGAPRPNPTQDRRPSQPGGAYSGPRPQGPRPPNARPQGSASPSQGTGPGQQGRPSGQDNRRGPERGRPDSSNGHPGRNPLQGSDGNRGQTFQGHNRGGRPGQPQRPGRRFPQKSAAQRPVQSTVGKLVISPTITVKDFASAMGLAASEVIRKLMAMGVMATINQEIDFETAVIIGEEFGVVIVPEGPSLEEQTLEETPDGSEDLLPRSPVVTVMGHVDHGKTSLLDSIRETKVTAQEAGGITQHIGAYQVEIRSKKITFLDTPGHEAFTAMRARGAQATDIAILVVAADDGVMPQTIEAINHVKAANIPIIVAINKIDKPGANPDRVKQELTEFGLVAEEWGGETIMAPVSAITREGLDHLLEMILLVAEVQDLKANPDRLAVGTVIEAKLDKGRGPVATVLVQKGTLHVGDVVLIGSVFGRVRLLVNDKGKRLKKAGPSIPVEVVGLTDLPEAGDTLYAVEDERIARQLADSRQQKKRETELKRSSRVSLDDLFSKIKEGELKELNIVVKADVRGSIEALQSSLERLENQEVRARVIHGGVGAVTESDIMLAAASNAIIIAFNVRPDPLAKRASEREGVDIRLYRVIYDAINDVKAAIEGMLSPEIREVVVGRAEVRQTFRVPKAGTIAGCYVIDGRIPRSAEVRLIRDHVVIHEGKIDSLKRFKDDVREVVQNYECGIGLEKYQDIKEGDIIEAFVMEEFKQKSS